MVDMNNKQCSFCLFVIIVVSNPDCNIAETLIQPDKGIAFSSIHIARLNSPGSFCYYLGELYTHLPGDESMFGLFKLNCGH